VQHHYRYAYIQTWHTRTMFCLGMGERQCVKWGKLWGFTLQFTHTNAPQPHDNCEAGNAWAWNNMHYVKKQGFFNVQFYTKVQL